MVVSVVVVVPLLHHGGACVVGKRRPDWCMNPHCRVSAWGNDRLEAEEEQTNNGTNVRSDDMPPTNMQRVRQQWGGGCQRTQRLCGRPRPCMFVVALDPLIHSRAGMAANLLWVLEEK